MIVYCDNEGCRYQDSLSGYCGAPSVRLNYNNGELDDFAECETCDYDCDGLEGYKTEYWIAVAKPNGIKMPMRKRRFGREIVLHGIRYFTSQKNPDHLTEARTGHLVSIESAKDKEWAKKILKRLAGNSQDVMSLPIYDEEADK